MSTSTEQAQNNSPTPPSRRKRMSVKALVCVATIVVVLLAGSSFWLMHAKSSPASKTRTTATATPPPTWMPTAITPPAISMFYDTFINNSHGWSLGSGDGYFRILVNDTLILADTNPNTPLVEAVPASTTLDNYVVSADFTINQGDANDGIGLYLRGDSTLDHDYRVDINGNNTLDIAKEYLDNRQDAQTALLFPPQHISFLKPPGQHNTLTVIMIDATITVEINNFVVATVTDSTYTSGQIALFARHGSTSSTVTVSFSKLEIDRVASPFDTPTPTPTLTPTPTAGQP